MVRKRKGISHPVEEQELHEVEVSRLKLALKTALVLPRNQSEIIEANSLAFDLLQKEVECARLFNFELPEDLSMAMRMLENAVSNFTQTEKNVILVFNDRLGTYTCLNDEIHPDRKPRELTQISDGFLRDLLDTDEAMHTYLFSDDSLIGIVAVAEPKDGPLGIRHEILLELAAQYLSTKVLAFQNLRQTLTLSLVQKTVLEISAQLITAVDQEGVLIATLDSLGSQLDFGICQYIHLDPETGVGEVLLEYRQGDIHSFIHAGLKSKRQVIDGFASLVSLFTSVARSSPYLHIPGNTLGEKPLHEIFGIQKGKKADQAIHSAVILPVMDPTTGKIRGTFNLYRTRPHHIVPESLEVAKEVAAMVSLALSRVMVLELALEMASTDELTGLTNRRGFYDRFEAEIERARRNQTSLCVAMVDVDYFKRLNDTYGHLSGDCVLRELAEIFRQSLRKSDLICRFGGEEFAILLPDTSFQAATDLLERIRKTVSQTAIQGIENEVLQVSVSVGLAQVNTDRGLGRPSREVISDALAIADEQLYLAKEHGRNRVCATCEGHSAP